MLYQAVRPQTFDEVLGNDAIVQSLKALVNGPPETRPHSYLFVGDSGCGKTTLARIFASSIGCSSVDFCEMNAANTRGIDTVRDVVESASTAPMLGNNKVYLFDEAHQLTAPAQEALLKVIEDPPSFCYFILCTTDPSKLIPTIKNRCAMYEVARLRPPDMKFLLQTVAEVFGYPLTDEVCRAIVTNADGCAREALMTLEKLTGVPPENALEVINSTQSSEKDVLDLCRILSQKHTTRWRQALDVVKALKISDTEGVRRQVLGYFKTALLEASSAEDAARASEILTIFEKSTYYTGLPGLANLVFQACVSVE